MSFTGFKFFFSTKFNQSSRKQAIPLYRLWRYFVSYANWKLVTNMSHGSQNPKKKSFNQKNEYSILILLSIVSLFISQYEKGQ